MNPKSSKIIVLISLFLILILLISEGANYLSNASSPSSIMLNKFFIDKSISEAKNDKFNKAVYYLSIASRINIYGEYSKYRNLLPSNYSKQVALDGDSEFERETLNYLSGLTPNSLMNNEDQGLAWIYYNLGLVAYKTNNFEIVPELFKKAIYNYPEFPSFHAELINYYYSRGRLDDANQAMDYCHKFKDAAIFCDKYKDDINKFNIPQVVGYMEQPIKDHYIKQ
jgi:tetratricopeptide (TPR) repeat protein